MADATANGRTNRTDSNERDGEGVAECLYGTVCVGGNERCGKMCFVRRRCDGEEGCNGSRNESEHE